MDLENSLQSLVDYWFLTGVPPKSPSFVLKIKNSYFWAADFSVSPACGYDVILTIFVFFFAFLSVWVKFRFFLAGFRV